MNWSKTHLPCPDTEGCGSSDGAAISKDDGSIHCFACGQHFKGDRNRSTIDPLPSVVAPPPPLPSGTYADIEGRGISKTTCELYHYQQGTYQGRPAHFAQVKGQDGENCAVHIRILKKEIRWKGSPRGAQLFGQHIGTGSHLVITEGELDAMSVHEAYRGQPDAPVVVSITSGVSACIGNLEANLTFINQFDRVTIFFDSDEPGRQWAAKAAALIGAKTRIVSGFGFDDANDAWINGTGLDIRDAIAAARIEAPIAVALGIDLLPNITSPKLISRGLDLAWDGWNTATQGLRPGELWLIAGGTGLGKSTITRSMALHLASNGTKVAYFGLEETQETTFERMLSEQLGVPLHEWSGELRHQFNDQISEAANKFGLNIHLCSDLGEDALDTFAAFVRGVEHLVVNEGCRVVFLDHFSWLADDIALNVDQRRAIDKAIKDLKELAMKFNFTFVVVSHLSRGSNLSKSHEEGAEPRLSDLRGSHSLAQVPDYIVMIQRDPETSNKTICHLKKNRVQRKLGKMCELELTPAGQFHEVEVMA